MTSSELALGSLTVFQSSRVARPQDASKAPCFVSLLRSSARSNLDASKQRMLRPVSDVADTETQLGPASRCVDPVFQHIRRHYASFVRDLMKGGSVEFVEDAVEHIGLFFVAKKAGAQRFIIDACASNRHFFYFFFWTVAHFARSNLRRCPKTLRTGLSVQPIFRTRSITCGFVDGCGRSSRCPLSSHPKLGTQEKRSIEDVLLPYALSPRHCEWVLLGQCFSAAMSQIIARSWEMRTLLFSSVVTTPHTRCSVANMAWDPLASVVNMLIMLEIWLAAQTALTIILHVSLQVFRRPVSMFTTYLFPAEVLTFLGTKWLQPTHIAVELANGYTCSEGLVAPSH